MALLNGTQPSTASAMAGVFEAAALVSGNKQRAAPASVDGTPTSANQEEHVAMAAHGARRKLPMAANAGAVPGIELFCAAQGCNFHAPRRSTPPLEAARGLLRRDVPHPEGDRLLAPETGAAVPLPTPERPR